MRIKLHVQQYLSFRFGRVPKIVEEYQGRYNRISEILDANPGILDAFHSDLKGVDSPNGRESTYSSEQFLRMFIVKTIEGLSLRDTIIRVSDSFFLKHFTRLDMGSVMTFAALDMIFKRIRPETWEKINGLLFEGARRGKKISGKRLRMDSTVSETNIHYPTEASLLWDSYRVVARLMRQCVAVEPFLDLGHRFHDKKVKRLYTFVSTHSSQKKGAMRRAVRRGMKKLIKRVDWICGVGRNFAGNARRKVGTSIKAMGIVAKIEEMLPRMEQVVACARRVHENETVQACERIFSIFEPHTELLIRGKAHRPFEFGHMVSIGQTAEKFISFYRVEEKSRHDIYMGDEALNDHRKHFGEYPQEFAADKNYYGGLEHAAKWRERICVYSVGKKGRRDANETQREHGVMFRLLQKFRAGCEGSISVLKRVFGLYRCLFRGFKSFASSVGCTVFCHNLVVLSRL